jgi:hypothetical protein
MEAYTVPGWPSGTLGHAAVTPHLNRTAGSGWVQYKERLTGIPGTQQIPAAGPGVEQSRTAQQNMGRHRSSDSPPWWLPQIWFARPQPSFWPGGGQPVSVRSDNLMPVPATDPRGVPARLAVPLMIRGQRQIRQPAAAVTWPAWNG